MSTDLEQRPTVIDGEVVPDTTISPAAKAVLQFAAFLFFLAAGFMIWSAATGYRI